MADKKPLNLDELFGLDAPVKVLWNKREYELVRLNALDVKGIMRFQKLYQQATELQGLGNNLSDEQVELVDEMFDRMLETLCPSLPLADMPYLAKVRALTYYIEETEGKKALKTVLTSQPTGGMSSAG